MARPLASLRSRVFAATALVAVVPLAAALLFVTRRVAQQAEGELTRSLDEAARLVGQYHRTQIETATERASPSIPPASRRSSRAGSSPSSSPT